MKLNNLEEAIKNCEEVAGEQENKARVLNGDFYQARRDACLECAKEHRQLANWLKELKAYRGLIANADKMIEAIYGVVIVEGYGDVFDKMKAIYEEVNADEY